MIVKEVNVFFDRSVLTVLSARHIIMNKSQRASETQKKIIQSLQLHQSQEAGQLGTRPDDISLPPTSLEDLNTKINIIKCILSDPFRKPSKSAKSFLKEAIDMYEQAHKASIGMPTYTDNATLQSEARNDIPTVPLSGLVPVQRTAYIVKSATQGTTAGGFFTQLVPGDLVPWVSSQTGTSVFRVKMITSWTIPRQDGGANQASFAGVAIPAQSGASGTEVLPTWSENWEPVGQGFAGITTKFPLGAYPLYLTSETAAICAHYTSLGNTGGITAIPVVFHVTIETLI